MKNPPVRKVGIPGFIILAISLGLSHHPATAGNVTFQVIMTWQEQLGRFNSEVDQVVVRGSFNQWGEWGNGVDLICTQAGDSIWAGTTEILPGDVQYNYIIVREAGWQIGETIDYRSFQARAADCTLEPVYFNDDPPENDVKEKYGSRFNSSLDVSIYPVPSNGSVTLSLEISEVPSEVAVFSVLGSVIFRTWITAPPGTHELVELPVGNHPSGSYYCLVSTGERNIVLPFILLK